jgi:hypothetical protein
MITICVIESHQSPYIKSCLESLRFHTRSSYEVRIFHEENSREATLNTILAELSGRDLIVVADDIVFTEGWDRAMQGHWDENRVLGFSMLYPGSKTIQDRGYRLISFEGEVSTEAIDRGQFFDSVEDFDYKPRTAITGCFQAIPGTVSKIINKFPLDGANRWGELLFQVTVARRGFEVGVLGHFLEHHGKSTKQNKDIDLRSESYLIEKQSWSYLVAKYRLDDFSSSDIKRQIDHRLRAFLQETCLLYGAGTTAEYLGGQCGFESHQICSGLHEEKGREFLGKKIDYLNDIDWEAVNRILITVEGKQKEIAKSIRGMHPKAKIYMVVIQKSQNIHEYGISTVD